MNHFRALRLFLPPPV